jgi:hypothetical protein
MIRKVIISIIIVLAVSYGQTLYKGEGQIRMVPKLLNYQGYLTDTLGNPITNPSLSMTFTIFDAASAGIQKWTESQSVSVDKGIFHVLLGNVTPIPDSVFTASTNRWLALTISGQSLTPRTRIVTSSYAYTATYSDTATYARNTAADSDWVISGSNMYSGVSGNVGIGISNPGTYKLNVNGNVHATTILLGNSSGPIYENWWEFGADNGDGVGIDFHANISPIDYSARIYRQGGDNADFNIYNGGNGNLTLGTNGWLNRIVINSSGNVGIGIDNPLVKLDVNGVICGGTADTVKALYGGVLSGYSNLAGDANTDTAATVCGGWNNSALNQFSFVGGGRSNRADSLFATVAGGYMNIAHKRCATVGGGWYNMAWGGFATIGGGIWNVALDSCTTVNGGSTNYALGWYATVGGGFSDSAKANSATVCGGFQNTANADAATVGGGVLNKTDGPYATIGGGSYNQAGAWATVAGGWFNKASSAWSAVGGGHFNWVEGSYAIVGGGDSNTVTLNGHCGTIGGGRNDTVLTVYGAILGGNDNLAGDAATDTAATVCGGWNNSALDKYTFVGGGFQNSASGTCATVGGGNINSTSSRFATVAGGYGNIANGPVATIAGGQGNMASNFFATVAGGFFDTVAAQSGFATNYSTSVLAGHDNSAAFTTSHTTNANQVRAATFSTGILCFTMDHPDNPMKEILNQYAVGSDDPVLIYNGTAYIAENGRVEVNLPDYFDKINRNPRIQLTGVGTYEVFIAEDVKGNTFAIGGKAGTKVYWTVTAERKDINAEIARIQTPVEQPKTGELINHSLDDDALIGIYDDLNAKKPGIFAFKTEEGRRVHEQSKKMVEKKK